MNKLLITIVILFTYSGIFGQGRTTLPNNADQSPSNKNLENLNGQLIQDRLVVNDSAWFNGVHNVFQNGKVGIGTTTPHAKFNVVYSGVEEIASFDNGTDAATIIITTPTDSGAYIFLESGESVGGIGNENTTHNIVISDGKGNDGIIIDTNTNVTIPDLAGSGTRIVTASSTGLLTATSIATNSGTYTPTVTNRYGTTSLTAGTFTYMQIDSVVTIAGSVALVDSSSSLVSWVFKMSLPIASDFALLDDAVGTGTVSLGSAPYVTVIDAVALFAQASTDLIYVTSNTNNNSTNYVNITCTYKIK